MKSHYILSTRWLKHIANIFAICLLLIYEPYAQCLPNTLAHATEGNMRHLFLVKENVADSVRDLLRIPLLHTQNSTAWGKKRNKFNNFYWEHCFIDKCLPRRYVVLIQILPQDFPACYRAFSEFSCCWRLLGPYEVDHNFLPLYSFHKYLWFPLFAVIWL